MRTTGRTLDHDLALVKPTNLRVEPDREW
jgi:hypothetical protein